MDPKKLGQEAEKQAVTYLKNKGYQILATNYRNQLGEIDIIAKDQDELVFVEVKALSNAAAFDPMDHITIAKQKKLIQLAQSYTSERKQDINQRIDIILVYSQNTPWTIDHFIDALEC